MNLTLTHNKQKITIGWIVKENINGRSTEIVKLWINEGRYFQEMGGFGFDSKLANRLSKYKYIQFNLYTGKRYIVFMEDFLANAWTYPKKGSQFADTFAPKLVMEEEKIAGLNEIRRKRDDEEWEKIKLMNL
jgi:hypothetical protein